MSKLLYVNQKPQQGPVYEIGKSIAQVLQGSQKHDIAYCECSSYQELTENYRSLNPEVIIYNNHPDTMTWLQTGKFDSPLRHKLAAVHIGTIHHPSQHAADNAVDDVFDFHIAADPTLMLKNPIVFKTGRLLPEVPKAVANPAGRAIIGSYGLATNGSRFAELVTLVQQRFDEATIRLKIPVANLNDEDLEYTDRIVRECSQLITKPGITLEIDNSYLEKEMLLDFLKGNSINVFLDDAHAYPGISAIPDWALASGRPLAISKRKVFRHLFHCRPGICVEETPLNKILDNGTAPIEHLWKEWSPEGLLWDYERIIDQVMHTGKKSYSDRGMKSLFYLRKVMQAVGIKANSQKQNVWTKIDDEFDDQQPVSHTNYQPLALPAGYTFNRILDNEARKIYAPTISFLSEHLPHLMKKKIAEANVQQAFVLDTAVRFANQFNDPAILAVGAYEDTAAQGLKMLNYKVDEIDPILNYDLATFKSKPSTTAASYDIVISTSVIEHVQNDEQFVADIEYLLKPNGVAILTCDYNDAYVKGDSIPEVDCRFYTRKDLEKRLLSTLHSSELEDEPDWICDKPDFYYLKKYNYTFASFVFRKRSK